MIHTCYFKHHLCQTSPTLSSKLPTVDSFPPQTINRLITSHPEIFFRPPSWTRPSQKSGGSSCSRMEKLSDSRLSRSQNCHLCVSTTPRRPSSSFSHHGKLKSESGCTEENFPPGCSLKLLIVAESFCFFPSSRLMRQVFVCPRAPPLGGWRALCEMGCN